MKYRNECIMNSGIEMELTAKKELLLNEQIVDLANGIELGMNDWRSQLIKCSIDWFDLFVGLLLIHEWNSPRQNDLPFIESKPTSNQSF